MRAAIVLGILVLCTIVYSLFERTEKSTKVTVYTYSSFASSWGAGPALEKEFKRETNLDVNFIDVGEAELLIPRLKAEGHGSEADLIMGLNQLDIESAKQFVNDDHLKAYSWSPITMIYRKSDNIIVPRKLVDLVRFNNKVIFLNPHTSTPGLLTFAWIVQKLGPEKTKQFFIQIKKNVIVAPSWSAGYGLFKHKQAQLIFSYLTSPVYHWVEEKNEDYQPVYLQEPVPYQKEYAGLLKRSPHPKNALRFFEFLFSPEAQKIIMNKNFMLPVMGGVKEGTPFANLKETELFELPPNLSKDDIIKVWDSIPW